jgi:hypothetical protein
MQKEQKINPATKIYSFVSAGNVLETVISLYTLDWNLPLPTMDEVLLCTETTTAEEVCWTAKFI